ncbi:transglycosylase SLT domain-containing protein [bacterium]|nr:transglycosylase SLT domain-containing protein [bacterium]
MRSIFSTRSQNRYLGSNNFSSKQQQRSAWLWLALGLIVVALTLYLKQRVSEPSTTYIAKGFAALSQGDAKSALIEFTRASKSAEFSDWTKLGLAKTLFVQEQYDSALQLLGKIGKQSSASIEAQILKLEIAEIQNLDFSAADQTSIFKQINRFRRQDLLPRFSLLRAKSLIRAGDVLSALKELRSLRTAFPKSFQARQALHLALEHNQDWLINDPVAAVDELKLLLKEKHDEAGINLIKSLAQAYGEKDVQAQFQLKLFTEKFLRLQQQNDAADQLLLSISADGPQGAADEAILRIANNAWNINDHDRALTFLSQLKERFPKSPLLGEAHYVEARIYEELKELKDAEENYLSSIRLLPDGLTKVRAFGRLAWLYRQNNETQKALDNFEAMEKLARELPNAQSEFLHARFWARKTNPEKFAPQGQTGVPKTEANDQPEQDWMPDYYSLLAQPSAINFECSGSSNKATPCLTSIDPALTTLVEQLKTAGLKDLAQHEVNFRYPIDGALNTETFKRELQRLTILKSISPQQYLITESAALLKIFRETNQLEYSKLDSCCRRAVLEILYPQEYQEQIKQAAVANGLDPKLLTALMRTESAFNAEAESKAGAKGLLQLMDKTVLDLNPKFSGNIYDPSTNIRLGAQYFKQLLKQFSGNEVQAIAAYNAGPAAVNRWLSRTPDVGTEVWIEFIGYPETRDYVKRVIATKAIYEKLY